MAANPNSFLFLVPNSSRLSPHGRIRCVKVKLFTEETTWLTFTNTAFTERLVLKYHACISYGCLVLILGGYDERDHVTNAVHIFDTDANTWECGPNMMHGRANFAWGVIGDRLYIAGGYGGGQNENLQETEVYDFRRRQWALVAPMPDYLEVEVFFVFSGRLYVQGRDANNQLRYLCYFPDTNVWEVGNTWLTSVLRHEDGYEDPVEWLSETYSQRYERYAFVVTIDNTVYKLIHNLFQIPDPVPEDPFERLFEPNSVHEFCHPRRLHTLRWVGPRMPSYSARVFNHGTIHNACIENTLCFCEGARWWQNWLPFLVCGNKVIVIMHYPDTCRRSVRDLDQEAVPIMVEHHPDRVEVSVSCPFAWSAAVINGSLPNFEE